MPTERAADRAAELYPALPEDIAKSVWSSWPRKGEAHLQFRVRKRMVTSRVLSGALQAYACPDNTIRIPLEQLQQAFGESSVVMGPPPPAPAPSSSGPVQQKRLTDADLELDDPLVGMFRECRLMLKEEREHSRAQLTSEREHMRAQLASRDKTNEEQLKLLVNPINTATKLLQEGAERLAARVEFLEKRQDDVMAERELMADFRHVRDLELTRAAAQEQRRDSVLKLLHAQLPAIIGRWTGDSLRDFVLSVRPELVQLLVESGLLDPKQVAVLQALLKEQQAKAAAAAKPAEPAESTKPAAAAAAQPNGAQSAHSEENASS